MDARGATPERVEFENILDNRYSEEEILSEMDEDEWTDRNFGNSILQDNIGLVDNMVASSSDSR